MNQPGFKPDVNSQIDKTRTPEIVNAEITALDEELRKLDPRDPKNNQEFERISREQTKLHREYAILKGEPIEVFPTRK